MKLIETCIPHLRDILSLIFDYATTQSAVVVYDTNSPLAVCLTKSYRQCLPTATFIDFYQTTPDEIMTIFYKLKPGDLVVLIQSTSFRLDAFRLRVELFKQALKVIEHPHLERMVDHEAEYYINALAYDPTYYRGTGKRLKQKIDHAKKGIVNSYGEQLLYDSPFEAAKLNVGDYTGMQNIGGQFPIGEVFTEAQDLEAVHGRVNLFAFGDATFAVTKPAKPITLVIEKGRVMDTVNAPPEFCAILETIRADEGEVWVRELGFGMNKAFSQDRIVSDVGTYERMCGIHLSLGAKHGVYKKPNFKRTDTWHHVDVFVMTESVLLDEEIIYQNNAWSFDR